MSQVVQPLLMVKNVGFSYGRRLRDQNWSILIKTLTLSPNCLYSLRGSNMSGKSTLMRILAGQESTTVDAQRDASSLVSGSLIGGNLSKSDTWPSPSVKDIMLLAHNDQMFQPLSVWENVAVVGDAMLSGGSASARTRLDAFLASCGLADHNVTRRTVLQDLSSGAQAFVRLARAHCCDARILLIDEVTGQLDEMNADRFFKVMMSSRPANTAVVVVSHYERDHDLLKTVATSGGWGYSEVTFTTTETGGKRIACVEQP